MNRRQLLGFTVSVILFLALVFLHWLGPIFGYSFPKAWMIGGLILVGLAWGIYRQTDYARKN